VVLKVLNPRLQDSLEKKLKNQNALFISKKNFSIMKKIFWTLLAFLIIAVCHAQYSYQGVNSEAVSGKQIQNIVADNNGNVFVTGKFDYSLTLGLFTLTNNLPSNAFVAKLSSGGTVLWAKAIKAVAVSGTSSSASIMAVTTDGAGNLYLTGSFSAKVVFDGITLSATKNGASYTGDVMTAKMSASGSVVWAKAEGTNMDDFCAGAGEMGRGIGLDGAENVYTVGQFVYQLFKNTGKCNFACNTAQSNTAVTCVHIVKYSASGGKVFEKKLFNSQATGSACGVISFAKNIRFDGSYFYISGQVAGSVSFGNTTINTGGEGIQNVFLLKMDINGNFVWVKSVSGGKNICYGVGNGLFVDNNEIYLSGIFYGGTVSFGACSLSTTASAGYLAKYDASSGNCLWARTAAINYGIVRDPEGNLVALIRSAAGGCCNFLTELKKISPVDGSTIDSTVATMDVSTTSVSCFSGLTRAPDGFIFSQNLTGSYDLGGTTVSSTGSSDMVLVKYTFPEPLAAQAGTLKTRLFSNLLVHPNPASDRITMRSNDNKILGNISIYDMSGRLIYKKFIGTSQTVIDLTKFSRGMYYVKSDQLSAKFMKQ